jgi:hypothetical protein
MTGGMDWGYGRGEVSPELPPVQTHSTRTTTANSAIRLGTYGRGTSRWRGDMEEGQPGEGDMAGDYERGGGWEACT